MVAAVEKEMEARQMGISLTPEERFEVFGDHDPAQYDAEVEERWGDTDAYAQSQRRTAAYTKDDWLRIKAEAADVERRFAEALRTACPRTRRRRWTWPRSTGSTSPGGSTTARRRCTPGSAEMYVEDARFTAHYEDLAPGPGAVREHRRPGQRRPAGLTPAGRTRARPRREWDDASPGRARVSSS